ncbi:outer membrane beta-barrel protein [Candidatus Bandiella numerosa]|uniref:outer membrane protein n=1 Tax=Candidatus Bandiella numerosa TaxID=2570586 RepID=UPI00249EC873|nr:outer membrane beta-barrel protein [Candidatus Bandiella numerosa]WHA04722.1 outer membrane beta-barrel protein [Candidatus Bandiella numerosa]
MKNILKILLLLVLLQSNQDLYASEKNSYIRVDFGIPYYNKLSEDYEKTRLHGGQLYNVGLGYKFNNNFRADLTISKLNNAKFSYRTSDVSVSSSENNLTELLYQTNAESLSKFNVNSAVIMTNLYYDLLNYKIFNVYTGLGIGMSQNSVSEYLYDKKSGNLILNAPLTYVKYSKSNKNNSFAYGLTLGSSFKISDSSLIDLNYKYYDLGKIKHKADKMMPHSDNIESKHKVHVISFGLRVFM